MERIHITFTPLELAQLQVGALFVHNASSRLLRINEPDPTDAAPRFFLTRTQSGNLWRTRHNLPPELVAQLEQLASQEPPNLDEFPRYDADYAAVLAHHAPVTTNAGPAFYLPELIPPRDAVTITPQNVNLLRSHFDWLFAAPYDYAPVSAVVADGAAVAVCFSSRITPHVCEAGIYTEVAYRGRGYAPDVVRGWAAAVRASGRLPLYSTSWSNTASQGVARKLGAVQYAVNYSLT